MRLLAIHSDFFEYEVTGKTKVAEEVTSGMERAKMEEAVVSFLTVEDIDEGNPHVVEDTAFAIEEIAGTVKTKNIMLYPYAHLSSALAKPSKAIEILKGLEKHLRDKGYEVHRSPFGYYKKFIISCKGHPLSELSRSILPRSEKGKEEVVSQAVKAETILKSSWKILTRDGVLHDAREFDYSRYPNLLRFMKYETSKVRGVDVVPPHVTLMQKHELVDYEPGSDAGNLRWYPKGTLIKRLLEQKITDMVMAYGGMEVETPIMYDMEHPLLSKYLQRFPARQYVVKSGEKDFFLRFAACFGQYLMKHDMTISYRNLPVKMYELTHFSFRREQSGELVGLRRLRGFTMPDLHTLVSDVTQAKQEFLSQFKLCMQWMDGLGLEYEVGLRFVKSFFDENRDLADELVRLAGKPALVELWDERFFYYIMKFEFNIVDNLDKASALSTVQIDVENTERFDITYTDEEGRRKYPLMLHASISGGIDRVLYALLEKAHEDSTKGKKPSLPFWLSPTQVRVVPVSEKYINNAETILTQLSPFRVDIDDRSESLQKKIREAETEWVPYIVVIGEKEEASGTLSVRVRGGGQKVMTAEELLSELTTQQMGNPERRLPLSRHVSERPRFR
jgi:threonyl-tRNA synthetase